jgi:hypothetical protein
MKRHQHAPTREDFDRHEVGLIEEAFGDWDVKYPWADEMIREDYVERDKRPIFQRVRYCEGFPAFVR